MNIAWITPIIDISFEDMNVVIFSQCACVVNEYLALMFPSFSKKKLSNTINNIQFFHLDDVYEIFIQKIMNTEEVNNFNTFVKSLLSHCNVADQDRKKKLIIHVFEHIGKRMNLILKDCVEKYSMTTVFIFACQTVSQISKPVASSAICLHIKIDILETTKRIWSASKRLPLETDDEYMKIVEVCDSDPFNIQLLATASNVDPLTFKTTLHTLVHTFLKNKLTLREFCLRISASGISVSELALTILKIFTEFKSHLMFDVSYLVAAMEHNTHIVNKDFFVIENYMNLVQDLYTS